MNRVNDCSPFHLSALYRVEVNGNEGSNMDTDTFTRELKQIRHTYTIISRVSYFRTKY